jgi:hypothetical protein
MAFSLVGTSSHTVESINHSVSIEVSSSENLGVVLGVSISFVSKLVQVNHLDSVFHDLVSKLFVFKLNGCEGTKSGDLFLKVIRRGVNLLSDVIVEVLCLFHEHLPSLEVRAFHHNVLFADIVVQGSAFVGFTHDTVDSRRLDKHSFFRHAVRLIELVGVVFVVDVSSDR